MPQCTSRHLFHRTSVCCQGESHTWGSCFHVEGRVFGWHFCCPLPPQSLLPSGGEHATSLVGKKKELNELAQPRACAFLFLFPQGCLPVQRMRSHLEPEDWSSNLTSANDYLCDRSYNFLSYTYYIYIFKVNYIFLIIVSTIMFYSYLIIYIKFKV